MRMRHAADEFIESCTAKCDAERLMSSMAAKIVRMGRQAQFGVYVAQRSRDDCAVYLADYSARSAYDRRKVA